MTLAASTAIMIMQVARVAIGRHADADPEMVTAYEARRRADPQRVVAVD